MNKKVIIFSFLILSLLIATPVLADGDNRAGLVIVFGDGTVHTECISFSQQQISGFDLLERSELEYITGFDPGAGAAVCSVDGQGCSENDCFCDYPKYWTYWHLEDGEWVYSQIGTSSWLIKDGSVDAWKWGVGAQPPEISFDQICGSSVPQQSNAEQLTTASPSTLLEETGNQNISTSTADKDEASHETKSIASSPTIDPNHQDSQSATDRLEDATSTIIKTDTPTAEKIEESTDSSPIDPDNGLVFFGILTLILSSVFLVIFVQNKS